MYVITGKYTRNMDRFRKQTKEDKLDRLIRVSQEEMEYSMVDA